MKYLPDSSVFSNTYALPSSPIKILIRCSWKFPPNGYTCANTDGSALGSPGHCGLSCVMRDFQCGYIKAISSYIGFSNNNTAKFCAIRTCLQLAKSLGISHLLIRTNSMYAFRCLCRDLAPIRSAKVLVHDARQLVSKSVEVKIQVIYREANLAVDLLARVLRIVTREVVLGPCVA